MGVLQTVVISEACALRHERGGVVRADPAIDGGGLGPSESGKIFDLEGEFNDTAAGGLELFDLALGSRLPSLDSLLLRIRTQAPEELKVFCGRPEHADDDVLHGFILSVTVRQTSDGSILAMLKGESITEEAA